MRMTWQPMIFLPSTLGHNGISGTERGRARCSKRNENLTLRLHVGDVCPRTTLSCFHYKEVGHIKRYSPKLRHGVNVVRAERPRSTARVFTMSGAEASDVDGLIKGNCMVAGIPLLVLFDSGATHSFICIECVNRLKESLPYDFVVSTPTGVLVVVSTVVSRCPVVVNGRTFTVDLIYLTLSQLDLFMGMDWLSANHVMLNFADKTVVFGDLNEISDEAYLMKPLSAKGVELFPIPHWACRVIPHTTSDRSDALAQARDSRSGENLTVSTGFLSLKRPIPRLGETPRISNFKTLILSLGRGPLAQSRI
ncbi:hypothetical protein Lal_00041548 [Lupinus albus]|nr:hypothetical protein Lal_00041548 [Lupinus albus]